jgi:hypothetical protein
MTRWWIKAGSNAVRIGKVAPADQGGPVDGNFSNERIACPNNSTNGPSPVNSTSQTIHPDVLVDHLMLTFSQCAIGEFRKFLAMHPMITKWMIASDFVINEPQATHDAYAFTFFPQNAEIEDIKASIAKSLPKDFKNTTTVTSEIKEYFHSGETFTICLLTAKTCRAAGDIATVRRLIDETLNKVMRNWHNADSQRDVIREFEQLKEKAKANNFKPQLMSTMVIATVLAAFCQIILAQERKIERVGWFPDRDNIMTSYNRIAEAMFAINFSAFCQRHKVDERPIVTLIGRAEPNAANPKQSWYDELVRIPDFLAAALANWHYNKNDKTTKVTGRQKYVDMLQGAVADNPYVIPLLLVETESGICVGKLRCSKDPIAQECQQTVS